MILLKISGDKKMTFNEWYKNIEEKYPDLEKKESMKKAYEYGRSTMNNEIKTKLYFILKNVFKELLNG